VTEPAPDAELLVDALEAVEACPGLPSSALSVIRHLVQGQPGVATELRCRHALRRWDELWRSGEYSTKGAVDGRVAAQLGVAAATVRWWRCWLDHVDPQQGG
jgi:hypothetical protein